MNNTVMFSLSYGLYVVTAREGYRDNGCITNTAAQVTDTPNRISLTVNKSNYTHDMIMRSGTFNVSILSEKATFATFKHFGFQSGRDVNKFADYSACKRAANGIYYITEGTNGYISAKVVQTVDLGTHTMFIAEVTDGEVLSNDPSTTYSYYQANIKPKPAAPASKRPPGYARSVVMFMREKNSRLISSAHGASMALLISKKLFPKLLAHFHRI